jgi:hypothetical protein
MAPSAASQVSRMAASISQTAHGPTRRVVALGMQIPATINWGFKD